jgi:cellulose synthase/poly-beta-1,6-N-acetylglucosamine synthase-like glycosyltransferase
VDVPGGHNADGLYWRLETALKEAEARLGALLGANGALYAIRRRLYVPPPDDTIVEDMVIPLLAHLRHGCAIRYDRTAIGREESAADLRGEFRRRCRIGTGNFQCLRLLLPLLDPRRGLLAWAFFSHKVMRWFCPFLLVGLLGATAGLAADPFYRAMLGGELALLVLTTLAFLYPRYPLPRIIRLAALFAGMNIAFLVGFWRWLSGRCGGTWEPTARPDAPATHPDF